MKIIHGLDNTPDSARAGAVTIGNFDGVHRGHARIIDRLRAKVGPAGGPVVVVTFDPHPVRILRPESCPVPLTWTDRKADLLGALGVDFLILCATTTALLQWSAEDFFDRALRRALDARAIVEGENFCFGHNRSGTVDLLRQLAARAGVELDVVEPLLLDGQTVSSSRIRHLIGAGDVDTACRMLTQPYRIRGLVTHGVARGAKLGFPTANLEGVDTLLPAQGVYAGRAWAEDRAWPTAIHVGPSPTFGLDLLKVEAHLIGFDGDLYGRLLEVDFLTRLRDIHGFASVTALKAQLAEDTAKARLAVGSVHARFAPYRGSS